jgi:hypothetical protein
MSLNWPAKTPTCHRAKCDELVGLVEQLVGQLHTTQMDLKRAQSALVAFDPAAEINDENLIDSFVPKFLSESKRVEAASQAANQPSVFHEDDDFEVEQFVGDSAVSLVAPPFSGWSFGGATGIIGNYYLDWTVDGEERISLVAGEIDSELDSGREATLAIDPLTQEYRLGSSDALMPAGNDLNVFYLWNERTESLHPIESGERWCSLRAHEAIVATTNGSIRELDTVKYSNSQPNSQRQNDSAAQEDDLCKSENPECGVAVLEQSRSAQPYVRPLGAVELATFFRQSMGSSQPVLVLKRD